MKNITIPILIVVMVAVAFFIGVLSIPYFINNFDPIPWLTLIIGATFGLIITIIVNHKSNKTLTFLEKSETRRRQIALTTIKNATEELASFIEIYFNVLEHNDETKTLEKRNMLKTFHSRFISILSQIQDSLPSLTESINDELHRNIETDLQQLHRLLIILESGNDDQFEENIEKISKYFDNLKTNLSEIN